MRKRGSNMIKMYLWASMEYFFASFSAWSQNHNEPRPISLDISILKNIFRWQVPNVQAWNNIRWTSQVLRESFLKYFPWFRILIKFARKEFSNFNSNFLFRVSFGKKWFSRLLMREKVEFYCCLGLTFIWLCLPYVS